MITNYSQSLVHCFTLITPFYRQDHDMDRLPQRLQRQLCQLYAGTCSHQLERGWCPVCGRPQSAIQSQTLRARTCHLAPKKYCNIPSICYSVHQWLVNQNALSKWPTMVRLTHPMVLKVGRLVQIMVGKKDCSKKKTGRCFCCVLTSRDL